MADPRNEVKTVLMGNKKGTTKVIPCALQDGLEPTTP